MIDVTHTELDDVVVVRPRRFGDDRGWFSEIYKRHDYAAAGIDVEFIQDNESFSATPFTLRGLHYQLPPNAQDKLVRVVRGSILDIAVDIRRRSPTFGRHIAARLDDRTGDQLFVPAGFAHAFITLEPDVHVAYKVSAPYSPADERSIRWNDPTLAIEWPDVDGGPVLSAKDAAAPLLTDQPDLF